MLSYANKQLVEALIFNLKTEESVQCENKVSLKGLNSEQFKLLRFSFLILILLFVPEKVFRSGNISSKLIL